MLEIPYWIEGVVPIRPIDIWGKAGSVPNGLVGGAACATTELWVEDLSNKCIHTKNLKCKENNKHNIQTYQTNNKNDILFQKRPGDKSYLTWMSEESR